MPAMNSAAASRSDRPFLPGDLDPSRALTRAMTGHALAQIRNQLGAAEAIVTKAWPRDLHAKAATSPTTTGGAAALQPAIVGGFVSGLQPQSAAARLMAAGIRVDLEGNGTVSLPRAATNPLPPFVAEGDPIPAVQPSLTAAVLGPVRKMSFVEVLTDELKDRSTENAELVIRTIMTEAAAKALDNAIFSTAPASASRPAGILAPPASALTATAGGGVSALLGDVGLLVGAITAAGGGAKVILFVPPAKAAVLPILAPGFALEVVATPALAATNTVVALDPAGFAYAFGPDPRIDTSSETLIHVEADAPLQISSGAQGSATLATPVRSMYQTQSTAIRLILQIAWCMRAPGLVQFIPSATW